MILIAPDKFKGTFTSAEIGKVIERYVRSVSPAEPSLRIEMADGGEGTAGILARLAGFNVASEKIKNPEGDDAVADYFISPDRQKLILDSASFLGRDTIADLNHYNPLGASSRWFGRFILDRINDGIRDFTIGVGGTMTVDGGEGLLQEVRDCIAEQSKPVTIKALIDVRVPLLPRTSDELSSLSFAKQKGVTDKDMSTLEARLLNLRSKLEKDFGVNLTDATDIGAGGGLALALKLLNAELIPGAEYILDAQLRHKGLSNNNITHIYTGEGCLDLQSFQGKVTGTIVNRYANAGVPVTIICGRNDLPSNLPLPANVTVRLLSEIC